MAARKKVTSKAPTRRAASPLGGRSVRRAPKKSAVKKTATRKAATTKKRPYLRIGERAEQACGVFVGIAKGENGRPDCYVYRGRYAEKRMTHGEAIKFAADCKDGGHTDWELPNRTTGALLYANGREDMRTAWHWLQETYAGLDASAWCQLFRLGYQSSGLKCNEFEVVLVRRVPIQ